MGTTARYCRHCGQPLPPKPESWDYALAERVTILEHQFRVMEAHDPRIGAEGWVDTIRRIARDVLRQEGR